MNSPPRLGELYHEHPIRGTKTRSYIWLSWYPVVLLYDGGRRASWTFYLPKYADQKRIRSAIHLVSECPDG